jgi:histidine ammonia-lyase
MLAVVASQALYVTNRQAPPALRGFTDMVRAYVPPLIEDRVLGPELGRLADAFTARVFAADEDVEQVAA